MLAVADPVQLHLGEENQAVIDLPARALLSGEGIGAAFTRLEETYVLTGDITVYIFEKTGEIGWEDAEALRSAFFQMHPEAAYNGEKIQE